MKYIVKKKYISVIFCISDNDILNLVPILNDN